MLTRAESSSAFVGTPSPPPTHRCHIRSRRIHCSGSSVVWYLGENSTQRARDLSLQSPADQRLLYQIRQTRYEPLFFGEGVKYTEGEGLYSRT